MGTILRIGIILLGVANLLSATIPTGIFILMIYSITESGIDISIILLFIILLLIECIKWFGFYQIAQKGKLKWFIYYIVYIIPIIYVSFNYPIYATIIVGYIISFILLYNVKKLESMTT